MSAQSTPQKSRSADQSGHSSRRTSRAAETGQRPVQIVGASRTVSNRESRTLVALRSSHERTIVHILILPRSLFFNY